MRAILPNCYNNKEFSTIYENRLQHSRAILMRLCIFGEQYATSFNLNYAFCEEDKQRLYSLVLKFTHCLNEKRIYRKAFFLYILHDQFSSALKGLL